MLVTIVCLHKLTTNLQNQNYSGSYPILPPEKINVSLGLVARNHTTYYMHVLEKWPAFKYDIIFFKCW